MGLTVFDGKGVAWDAKSPRFAEALNSSIEGEVLATYSVVNLGFTVAEAIGASARIRVRPTVVSWQALVAVLYWLHDRAPDRILISSFERNWSHELHGSIRHAVDYLAHAIPRNQRASDQKLAARNEAGKQL